MLLYKYNAYEIYENELKKLLTLKLNIYVQQQTRKNKNNINKTCRK